MNDLYDPNHSESAADSGYHTGPTFHSTDDGERFQLYKEIGVGAMGTVYKARDHALDKYVALKMIEALTPVADACLRHEASIAQSLNHPSIVRVHDVVTVRGRTCISMEYVHGQTLAEHLSNRGAFDAATVCRFALQICSGLEAAHAANIVHCDLKPSNLILEGDRVRILDFGVALSITSLNEGRPGRGTFEYMSPEQRQRLPVDHRTDLYSLGLVLFELLCGRLPTTVELRCISVDAIRDVVDDVPTQLANVIANCLQHNPNDRPKDATEIMLSLDGALQTTSVVPQTILGSQVFKWRVIGCILLAAALFTMTRYPARAVRGLRNSSTSTRIVLCPMRATHSIQPYADELDEYLRAVLSQFSGTSVWAVPIGAHIDDNVIHEADIILTGEVFVANGYTTVRLIGRVREPGNDAFYITVSAQSATEVQSLLWNKLASEPYLSGLSAGAVKPNDYSSELGHNAEEYLAASSVIRRSRRPGDLLKAIDQLNRVIGRHSRCALCYARRASAALLLHKLNRDDKWLHNALFDAQQALDITDTSTPVILVAAQAYAQAGRQKEAITMLRRIDDGRCASAEVAWQLGRILLNEGLYAEATQELTKAVTRNPLDTRILNTLGVAELMLPDYPAAIHSFDRILALDQDNSSAHVNLSSAYLRMGQYREAIDSLEGDVRKHPSAAGYSNLGMALFFVRRGAEGVVLFEKAAELEPKSEVYAGNLAHAYRWLGNKARADVTYQRAIGLALQEASSSPSATVLADLGVYYAALRNVPASTKYFQRARAASPSDMDVVYKEAVAASLLNIPGRSLELLRKLCERGYPMVVSRNNPEFALLRQFPEFSSLKSKFTQ